MADPKDAVTQRLAALTPGQRAALKQRLSPVALSGHQIIAQGLKAEGITHVYSIAGTPIDKTLKACAQAGVQVVGVRHQGHGVLMALAQNYVAGRLAAAVMLSAGPGVTQATTGVLVAWDNGWPLLVLGGRRPLAMAGQGYFQDLDAVPLFQPITKSAGLVADRAELGDRLHQAVDLACRDRPGPVYLDIPEEVLTATGPTVSPPNPGGASSPFPTIAARNRSRTGDPALVHQAAQILQQAHRPALLIGKGLRWSDGDRALQQLVNDYHIPFAASPMGQGYLPDDHPRCYTPIRSALLTTADVVLVVGARLNWTFRFGAELRADAEVIHIDLDATALGTTGHRTVQLVGDGGAVLTQLLAELAAAPPRYRQDPAFHSWLGELERQRTAKQAAIAALATADTRPMSPQRLVWEVQKVLPRDAICTVDGRVILAAAQQCLPTYTPAARFTPGSNGCIGMGIPLAIGAKLAQPQRRVVAICGDVGVGMSLMELETAVRYHLPLVVIIANNNGNSGTLKRSGYTEPDASRVTMFQPDLRYDQMVALLGGQGEWVETPEALGPALERAIAAATVVCLNVKVDPAAPYPVL
jgi:thiamine pyrophosphate-dependent acetolactate synthase large subunit-like protein